MIPRFDGIYASRSVRKNHGELPGDYLGNIFRKLGRPFYSREYVRFFEDGLMLWAGAIVSKDPAPCRPTLDRSWGEGAVRYQWVTEGTRIKLALSNGHASYATIVESQLIWEGGYGDPSFSGGLYDFLQNL